MERQDVEPSVDRVGDPEALEKTRARARARQACEQPFRQSLAALPARRSAFNIFHVSQWPGLATPGRKASTFAGDRMA